MDRSQLEIWKLQRDLEKVDEEIKTLQRANRPRAYFWTVKVTDFLAPLVAVLAAIAAWQSGYLNAAAAKNRAEEVSLQVKVEKLEAQNADLLKKKADLDARIVEAKRVLFPMKEQTEAIKSLSEMLDNGLDVRMYHGFGIDWVEMLVSGRSESGAIADISEKDLDAAFRAIEKIKRVKNLELHSLRVSSKTLAALPTSIPRVSFRECEMSSDLAELSNHPELVNLEFVACHGDVNVSRPVRSVGGLRLEKTGYASTLLAEAVEKFPSLKVLEVVNSRVTDGDVARLAGHPNLLHLSTFDNDVTAEMVTSLKAIPKLWALTASPVKDYSGIFEKTEIFPFPVSPFTKIDTLLRSSPSRLIVGRSVLEEGGQ